MLAPQIAVRFDVPGPKPDLDAALELLSPRFRAAIQEVSAAYRRAGIRHVLAGGLAAAAYGEPRATRDVDFLVGDEAFERHGSLVMFRPGVPLSAEGLPVDSLPIPEGERYLEAAFDAAVPSAGVPLIAFEHLVLMKIAAGRRRDELDLIAILQANPARVASARAGVAEHRPESLERFDQLAAEAAAER